MDGLLDDSADDTGGSAVVGLGATLQSCTWIAEWKRASERVEDGLGAHHRAVLAATWFGREPINRRLAHSATVNDAGADGSDASFEPAGPDVHCAGKLLVTIKCEVTKMDTNLLPLATAMLFSIYGLAGGAGKYVVMIGSSDCLFGSESMLLAIGSLLAKSNARKDGAG